MHTKHGTKEIFIEKIFNLISNKDCQQNKTKLKRIQLIEI